MDGTIVGETQEGVGVDVIDNNGATHEITFEKESWNIVYHQCEAYADEPKNRTPDENEHNEQARRYAKYYVYQERGYDTLDHTENPEYVTAVLEAVRDLSDAEFKQYFGALHQQLLSHHDASVERLVDIPSGARAEDAILYEPEIYLGIDVEDESIAETVKSLSNAHGLDYEAGTQAVLEATESDLEDWKEVGEHLLDITDEPLPLDIGAVSGIHIGYPNAQGKHEVQKANDPLDREPDARIELMPIDPGSIDEFRQWLEHHLSCQVRDCYAGKGLMPPEPYQVVGFGKFMYARRYDKYDLYPEFHRRDGDHNAVIL